jgi:hypothetical protein
MRKPGRAILAHTRSLSKRACCCCKSAGSFCFEGLQIARAVLAARDPSRRRSVAECQGAVSAQPTHQHPRDFSDENPTPFSSLPVSCSQRDLLLHNTDHQEFDLAIFSSFEIRKGVCPGFLAALFTVGAGCANSSGPAITTNSGGALTKNWPSCGQAARQARSCLRPLHLG